MSEQGVAAPSGSADAGISVRDAAAIIAAPPKEEKPKNSEAAAPQEQAAAPEPESAPEADAAPSEETPSGETDGSDDQEPKAPPIDPPRSWTKDDKAAFQLLPRETQERLLALDRTREVELRRGQNEAAERLKAAEAREQAAGQRQQQYEQALPQLLQQVDGEYQREFGAATWADIQEWSRSEPDKYLRWDASYKRLHAVANEAEKARQVQQQQSLAHRQNYIEQQDAMLREKLADANDPKKQAAAIAALEEVGFTRDELRHHAAALSPSISLHDHRIGLLIDKALRFDAAQKAAKTAAPKDQASVPPVQRPGSAPAKGEAKEARLKELGNQFGRTHSVKDAAKVIAALTR